MKPHTFGQQKMRRTDVIGLIVAAGFHGDQQTAIRLAVEGRVSRLKLNEALIKGRALKASGAPCGCGNCNEVTA